MVTTRGREASTNRTGDGPSSPNHDGPLQEPQAPIPPPLQSADPLYAAILQQLRTLTEAVTRIQQQQQQQHLLAAEPRPEAPPLQAATPPGSPQPHQEEPSGPPAGLDPLPSHRAPVRRGRAESTDRESRSSTDEDVHPRRRRRHRSPTPQHDQCGPPGPAAPVEGSTAEATRRQADRRLEAQERKLADLFRQFADFQGSSHEPPGYDALPPFSYEIQEEPVPHRFRMPQVDPYDGTTDPLDNINTLLYS